MKLVKFVEFDSRARNVAGSRCSRRAGERRWADAPARSWPAGLGLLPQHGDTRDPRAAAERALRTAGRSRNPGAPSRAYQTSRSLSALTNCNPEPFIPRQRSLAETSVRSRTSRGAVLGPHGGHDGRLSICREGEVKDPWLFRNRTNTRLVPCRST